MKKLLRGYAAGGWLAVLLGLLGFTTGCDQPDEYGCPPEEYVDYEVQGTVRLSGDQQPLSGVRVRGLFRDLDGKYYDRPSFPAVTTDAEGKFTLNDHVHSYWPPLLPLEFSKEGEVLTDTVDVSFEGIPLSGASGNWYKGKASKAIEVELDPADAPDPAPGLSPTE